MRWPVGCALGDRRGGGVNPAEPQRRRSNFSEGAQRVSRDEIRSERPGAAQASASEQQRSTGGSVAAWVDAVGSRSVTLGGLLTVKGEGLPLDAVGGHCAQRCAFASACANGAAGKISTSGIASFRESFRALRAAAVALRAAVCRSSFKDEKGHRKTIRQRPTRRHGLKNRSLKRRPSQGRRPHASIPPRTSARPSGIRP